MLSTAKHLAADRDRPVASLRVTRGRQRQLQMKYEARKLLNPALSYINSCAVERCTCLPLSKLHEAPWNVQEAGEDSGQITRLTPATQEMNHHLRAILNDFFPRSTPLSLLLLHISQLEHIHIAPKTAILHKRHRYHAPPSFLEQVLVNVRRTIRTGDRMLVHAGAGMAIILPDVEHEGAHRILERVYRSISLLQAETVIPPLKRETEILLGTGSYPKPGASLEDLLYNTGFIAHRLTLRPAVTAQLRGTRPVGLPEASDFHCFEESDNDALLATARSSGIPFMQLPAQLPPRLKHLIPHQLALELRCAPVGRDHNRLTVAMAQPSDTQAIGHLKEATSMSIYPVSCEVKVLDALLEKGW